MMALRTRATATATGELLDVQVECTESEWDCDDLQCQIAPQGNALPGTVENACLAMTIDGIDEVYCIVYE